MSAFKLLCDRLRNEATLAKSDGAGAFKKQSLDPDLKGGKKGKKPAGELEEDEAIASLHRKRMNEVKPGGKVLAKSTDAGDALAQVLETGGAVQTFAPIGAPVASPTEAVHRARAQSIQDAAFLNEMKAAGVAPADLVMLDGVLTTSRGLPDTARAPAFAAVRAQVQQQASLSPAARGISWDD